MTHIIHKLFFAWQADKEEAWLNQMAAKGMLLVKASYCTYVFEEGEPGAYVYRLELLENPIAHPETVAYLQFLQETDIETVGHCLRWVYYRRPRALGAFDIYSDAASRIRYNKRQMGLLLSLLTMNTMAMLINVIAVFGGNCPPVNMVCVLISGTLSIALLLGTIGVYKQIKELRKQRMITE